VRSTADAFCLLTRLVLTSYTEWKHNDLSYNRTLVLPHNMHLRKLSAPGVNSDCFLVLYLRRQSDVLLAL